MLIQGRLNQKLEERSYLMFEFPGGYIRRLPFFENVSLRESKRANFVKYQPLGRSSPLYNYFGADSRMFDLEFTMNLLHIERVFSKDLASLTIPANSGDISKTKREDFFNKVDLQKSNQGVKFSNSKNNAESFRVNYLTLVNELKLDDSIASVATSALITKQQSGVIDILMYWINMVRSSVVNNANTSIDGPPVVRITHGVMFQDIPCICLSYDLSWEENAGYEVATLLPRKITVSMNLAEFRHGDFDKYTAATPVKRDNIVGWETILEKNGSMSFDPLPIERK